MNFPILCVDDFYNKPEEIRKLAYSQQFNETEAICPGKRTDLIHEIDKEFFDTFCTKVFSLLYNFNKESCKWTVETNFQLTLPRSKDFSSPLNEGWNHKDSNTLAAGVVYLNANPNPGSGTTISKLKSDKTEFDFSYRDMLYSGQEVDLEKYQEAHKKHEENFEESIVFKNKFNRLIMYDADYWHRESNFLASLEEPRLTQVFFITSFQSDIMPVEKIKWFDV